MAAKTMDEIALLLKTVKFKKKLFGGVDEDDVWRVLERMQAEYRSVVEATEQRYNALLDERKGIICRQQKRLAQCEAAPSFTEGGDADG